MREIDMCFCFCFSLSLSLLFLSLFHRLLCVFMYAYLYTTD